MFIAAVIALIFKTLDDDEDEEASKKDNAIIKSDEQALEKDPVLALGT